MERLAAALFPHFCARCGVEGTVLCGACETGTLGRMTALFLCPGCRERTPMGRRCGRRRCASSPLDALSAMATYGQPEMRTLLHQYKYEGVEEAGEALGRFFGQFVAGHSALFSSDAAGAAVAPVPLHFFRRARRGFNQSERFARQLAERCGGRFEDRALGRMFRWRSQVELEEDERRASAAGSVFARGAVRGRWIIVDDVATTGATLAECARALKSSGASSVTGVVLLVG